MSILKEKSNFNLTATELLQNNSLFAPSVHCSYFSCLQLVKFAIIENLNVTSEDLNKEVHGKDSHKYLINKIGDEIRNYSREEHTIFIRNINGLKKFRVESDYGEIEVTTTESYKALENAKEIRKQLIKIFHV